MTVSRLYPIIRAVPRNGRELSGKPQVDFLKYYARKAVAGSATALGLSIDTFDTDEYGAPLPAGGVYWSLSHKPEYVAGVAAGHPIGIDVEKIRPVAAGLFDKVIEGSERELMDADQSVMFFRFWTAKEVVLKRVGVGIAGLSKCRIQRVIDDHHLAVSYQASVFTVAQTYFDDHLAAVLTTGQEFIEWRFE